MLQPQVDSEQHPHSSPEQRRDDQTRKVPGAEQTENHHVGVHFDLRLQQQGKGRHAQTVQVD